MSRYEQTEFGFFLATELCFLAIFLPDRFLSAQEQHNNYINTQHEIDEAPGLQKLRSALFGSMVVCISATALAILLSMFIYVPLAWAAFTVIAGTLVILWATLAIRGWEIQTIDGLTLTEKVNQWIFRAAYCLGTFLIVLGTLETLP